MVHQQHYWWTLFSSIELHFFSCLVFFFSSLFWTLFPRHTNHVGCISVLIFSLVYYLLQICELQIPLVSFAIYNCLCIVADTVFHIIEKARRRQSRKILWDFPWSQYQHSGEFFFFLWRISAGSPLCWKYHLYYYYYVCYTFNWCWMINNTFDSIWQL